MLVILNNEVIGGKRIEVGYVGVERYVGSRKGGARNKLAHNVYMAIVDVCIGDHVDKFTCLHATDLRHHHEQNSVLTDVPVIRCKNVLAALY